MIVRPPYEIGTLINMTYEYNINMEHLMKYEL